MRIDALIIVDKPKGMTSLGVVKEVKRRLQARRAGHIGTLDPFATGVLPIALNEGTKLIPFIADEPKEYEATLRLGEETATDDPTGKVISCRPWEGVSLGAIQAAFGAFVGKIRQTPPMFSAVKRDGKPLYCLARKGVEVERTEREVEILNIQIDEIALPEIRFRVSCSRGTYIRSLARDIGRKIGCGAHLRELRRVRSGPFAIEQTLSWEGLKRLLTTHPPVPGLISLREALPSLPEVIGDEGLIRKARHGREMVVRDFSPGTLPSLEKGQWLKITSPKEGLVAILQSELRGSEVPWTNPESVILRPLRVFQPQKQINLLRSFFI